MIIRTRRVRAIGEIQKSELIRKAKRKGVILTIIGFFLIILPFFIDQFYYSEYYYYVDIVHFVFFIGGAIVLVIGLTLLLHPSDVVEEKAKNRNFSKWNQERAIAFRDHIRGMGYSASISKELEAKPGEYIWATIKFENLNIDFLEFIEKCEGWGDNASTHYEYHYIVLADFSENAENTPTFKAFGHKVRKNFFSLKVVDFKWRGEELARILNNDEMLKRHILAHHDKIRSWIEIYPCKNSHGIRISPRPYILSEGTFPTVQALEAYDMIAFHIRKMVSTRSSRGMP